MPSRSSIQPASSVAASSISIPISSSEAIEAAACEIAQPWPWKRRSAIRPSATTDLHPELVAAERVDLVRVVIVLGQLAEVARALVVLEDEVAVEVVHHQPANTSCGAPDRLDQRVDVGGTL